jgi:hypothetical protein
MILKLTPVCSAFVQRMDTASMRQKYIETLLILVSREESDDVVRCALLTRFS